MCTSTRVVTIYNNTNGNVACTVLWKWTAVNVVADTVAHDGARFEESAWRWPQHGSMIDATVTIADQTVNVQLTTGE